MWSSTILNDTRARFICLTAAISRISMLSDWTPRKIISKKVLIIYIEPLFPPTGNFFKSDLAHENKHVVDKDFLVCLHVFLHDLCTYWRFCSILTTSDEPPKLLDVQLNSMISSHTWRCYARVSPHVREC